MPETKIFFDRSSFGTLTLHNGGEATHFSSRFRSKGSHARIDEVYNRQRTTDKVRVYQLDRLSQSKLFQDALELDTEQLVSVWHTKKSKHGKLIKYATNNELALVFSTSDGNVEKNLFRSQRHFEKIDYFKEYKFVQFLEQQKISLAELRAVSGMDENRIRLLVNNLQSFKTLMGTGLGLEQIAQIKPSIIESRYSHQLSNALKYVTMAQILGRKHTPPVAPVTTVSYPLSCSNSGSGYLKTFKGKTKGKTISHASSHEQLNIAYTKKQFMLEIHSSKLSARFEIPTEERKRTLDSQISGLKPEKMVFEWYLLEEKSTSGKVNRVMYCPELNCVISEKKDAIFPEKIKYLYNTFDFSPFYKEKIFANFLLKNGSSFEELRRTQGMTEFKILTMCVYRRSVSILMEHGIQLPDFAKISERRLAYVLSGLAKSSDVKCAMEYVDAREILGLSKQTRHSQFQLFQPALKPDSTTMTPASRSHSPS